LPSWKSIHVYKPTMSWILMVDYCLSFYLLSFGLCIICPSLIYGFWLPFWYLLGIVLSALLWFTALIIPLISFGHCIICPSLIYGFWLPLWYLLVIVLSALLWFTASDYPFGIFKRFSLKQEKLVWHLIMTTNQPVFVCIPWFLDYRWRSKYQLYRFLAWPHRGLTTF